MNTSIQETELKASPILSTVYQWCQENWLFLLIALAVAAALIFFVVLPLIRKIRTDRKKAHETAVLKQDLMAWDNLHKLARGGEDAAKAKENLSSKIGMIDSLFVLGMDMLRELNRNPYELPWFILLGEPASGKSSLLRNSQLETRVSAEEENKHEPENSLPLRFWSTPSSVVADISGRVFFDRWLEGSGAEWARIVELIRKKHSKHPLDGIILTIPADALLSDDEQLSRKKTLLISSEMNRLIHRTGMLLPCYVIVTKCDVIPGFREYFADSEESFRDGIFGWNNGDTGTFSPEAYAEFSKNVLKRLRDGRRARMLSRQVLEADENKRGAAAGEIYSFPENFNLLHAKISLYLKSLFGTENLHYSEKALLSGVFFTSAEDGEIALDTALAKSLGKPVDEAAVIKEPASGNRQGAFIRTLLKDFIFPRKDVAMFTGKELARRHLPAYTVCLLMLGLGLFWFFTGIAGRYKLENALEFKVKYYNRLATKFKDGSIGKSPLILPDESGKWKLAGNQTMHGDASILRMSFFAAEYDILNIQAHPSTGFALSSLLLFGTHTDMGYPQKARVHNRMQTLMVFQPLIQAAGEHLLMTNKETPVTLEEGAFIRKSLNTMLPEKSTLYERIFGWSGNASDYSVRVFLNYVLPDMNELFLSYFDSYEPKYGAGRMTENIYLLSQSNAKIRKKGIMRLLDGWNKLTIYPDSKYGIARRALQTAKDFNELGNKISSLKNPEKNSTPEAAGKWLAWRKELLREYENRRRALTTLATKSGLLSRGKKNGDKKEKWHLSGPAVLNEAILEWENLLNQDYRILDIIGDLRTGTANSLPDDFNGDMLDKWYADVQKKIETDFNTLKKLEKTFYSLCGSPEIDTKLAEVKETSGEKLSRAELLGELRFRSMAGCHTPPKKGFVFESVWSENEQRIAEARKRFEDFAKKHKKELEKFSGLVETERDAMQWSAAYSRYLILNAAAAGMPDSRNAVNAEIIRRNGGKKLFLTDEKTTAQSVGKIAPREDFAPDAVRDLTADAMLLLSCSTPEKAESKNAGKAITLKPDSKRIESIRSAMDDYLKDYISYWSLYPSELGLEPESYADFRKKSAVLKAYQTNTILREVYLSSAKNLKQLPESLLSKENAKKRAESITNLDGSAGLLTPHFTETCLRTVSNWLSLPENPLSAWLELSALPEQKLKLDYMIVSGKKDAGGIGWWTNYVEKAMAFLKRDASAARAKKYDDCISMIRKFPICADSKESHALSETDMVRFAEYLPSIGVIAPSEGTEKKVGEKTGKSAASKRDFTLSSKSILSPADKKWSDAVGTISEALANRKKPLVWTLVRLSAEAQSKMCETLAKGYPRADIRFRYMTMSGDFPSTSGKTPMTGGKKAVDLATGDILCDRIEFSFHEFSTGNKPVAKRVFENGWAALRIYLEKKAFYDPEQKMVCVPLLITDNSGKDYVYCVGIKFNKNLPSPDLWPKEADTPEFSARQENIKEKHFTVKDWKNAFLKAPEGEKGYLELLKLAGPLNSGSFPKMEIACSIGAEELSKYPELLKCRFVRIKTSTGRTGAIPTVIREQKGKGIRISFVEYEIVLEFYRHSGDASPVRTIRFAGPFAAARLLSAGRKFETPNGDIRIDTPLPNNAGCIPLTLKIVK